MQEEQANTLLEVLLLITLSSLFLMLHVSLLRTLSIQEFRLRAEDASLDEEIERTSSSFSQAVRQ